MNKLIIVNQTRHNLSPLKTTYRTILNKTHRHLKLSNPLNIEVVFVSNDVMRSYNHQYRKINQVTDVLSFPLNDNEVHQESPTGLIMIAYDMAIEQAKTYGHSRLRELSFLFIHGILHVLGYDHHTPKEEQQMLELQDAIIGKR